MLRGGLGFGERNSLAGEQLAELQDYWEDFIIPVGPLSVMRGLFRLHDTPVLAKNTVRKQDDERPEKMDEARYRRFANHHQAQAVIHSLKPVHRHIGEP